jgi:hypothetical protein
MEAKRWVQHISGQGAKWLVDVEGTNSWRCPHGQPVSLGYSPHYFFPKSEYVLCEGPEVWVDVTHECEWVKDNVYHGKQPLAIGMAGHIVSGYRLRKVHLLSSPKDLVEISAGHVKGLQDCWAFIVEKKACQ